MFELVRKKGRVGASLHFKELRENISRSILLIEILFTVYLRRIPLGLTASYSNIVRIVRDNQCNRHGFTNILCGTCNLYWTTKVRTRSIVIRHVRPIPKLWNQDSMTSMWVGRLLCMIKLFDVWPFTLLQGHQEFPPESFIKKKPNCIVPQSFSTIFPY